MSADHIAALEAALHTEAMNLPLEVLFGVLAEAKRLRAENEALRDVQEAAESMLGTCGCIQGDTPEDEDTHTHDGWAEEFLRECVAKAAQAAKERTC
jgi:hypothetical protein